LKEPVSGLVGGVDSGFAHKKLSFLDLVLIKTVGAIFSYDSGKVVKSEYFPSAFSLPEPRLLKSGLEKDEEQQSVSLIRLEEEINCAVGIIKKFKPAFLFIDGSIVPQFQDKPRKDSLINREYDSMVSLFQKFYAVAEENNCTLVACVEDSRGSRFLQLLKEESLKNSSLRNIDFFNSVFDVSFLDYFLSPGERTFSFPYAGDSSSHAILKDFSKDWMNSVFVFYIKPNEFDKPLRVEFLCKKCNDSTELKKIADKVASLVFSLSSLHKEYSFPSVLIEADLRAGLSEQEINLVYQRLIDRLGPKIRMRRNNRPFG
jgi:hypothetical protein